MRSTVRHGGAPLLRYRRKDLLAAGVERVLARTVSIKDGMPVLDDGRIVNVRNVIWCTGFRPDYSWLRVPFEIGPDGYPVQYRGVVDSAPGLYLVGMLFLHSFASMLIAGTASDAERVSETHRVAAAEPSDAGACELGKRAGRARAVTEDRDATSILVWNGRAARTRRTTSEGPRSRPVHHAKHEQNVDDHEEGGGGVEKPGAGEDEERGRDPDWPEEHAPIWQPRIGGQPIDGGHVRFLHHAAAGCTIGGWGVTLRKSQRQGGNRVARTRAALRRGDRLPRGARGALRATVRGDRAQGDRSPR